MWYDWTDGREMIVRGCLPPFFLFFFFFAVSKVFMGGVDCIDIARYDLYE